MPGKILIQSAKRDTTQSNSSTDFVITNINPSIDLRNKKYCRLTYAKIPNSIYNIQSPHNLVDIKESGQSGYSITITPGAYTTSTLTAELATLLTSGSQAGNTYTVTYNATTLTFTITANTTEFSLLFKTGTHAGFNVYQQLGFFTAPGVPVDTIAALSVTSPSIINLCRPFSFLIILSQFSPNSAQALSILDNSDGMSYYKIPPGSSCIANFLVENNGISGNVMPSYIGVLQRPEIVTIQNRTFWLSQLQVQLIDTSMNNIAELNGANWEMMVDFLDEKEYNMAYAF